MSNHKRLGAADGNPYASMTDARNLKRSWNLPIVFGIILFICLIPSIAQNIHP